MIKRVFLSLFIILSFYTLKANVDGWSLHLSYHNASKCEIMDNRVFVLASGSLYSYNEEDEEILIKNPYTNIENPLTNVSSIFYVIIALSVAGLIGFVLTRKSILRNNVY